MEDHPIEAVSRSVPRIAPFQPCLDVRMFVRAVVVNDQMQSDVRRHFSIELLEERQPLDVRMLGRDEAGDLPIEIVQCGEQRDGAVPDVVVRSRPNVPCLQRQARLGSFKGLALALLVAAQNQSLGWRVQIQPNDVPELRLEIRVG